ncbi:hypothetical protein JMUB6875_28970 [Nocardia sp. JMUB6875]|uniref:hypothetical protein n=1 Tax=Nocardia sp. JMUB6875 TaxID=3158170 RepID=UPI0032E60E0D
MTGTGRRAVLFGLCATFVVVGGGNLPAVQPIPLGRAQPPAGVSAPHLDAIEAKLREVSPGLRGSVWQRTAGNQLAGAPNDASGWLLQNPGCWGDAKCAARPGTERLLARMLANISHATRTVDISSLGPFPDGRFHETIVAGLQAATAGGKKLAVRILMGNPVPLGTKLKIGPAAYRDTLVESLGAAAADIDLNVGEMASDDPGLSWNHSKLLVVDGESVIAGGINDWAGDYLDAPDPVIDVDLAVNGPAAGIAGRFLDSLWAWTCDHRGPGTGSSASGPASGSADSAPGVTAGSSGGSSGFGPSVGYSSVATANGADCFPRLEDDRNPMPAEVSGGVPVIAVGGLGNSLALADKSSDYNPRPPDAAAAGCIAGVNIWHDYSNADRNYDTVNPDSTAQRELVASAREHIEISQQDLIGPCPAFSRYDVRLFDVLAAKMVQGVKVRIVVSDPANHFPPGGYSNIGSLAEVSNALLQRLELRTGGKDSARSALCRNLQLASIRAADTPKWANGKAYRQHTKLIAVDGAAFYIGSKNLYPAWLQEYGLIVEDTAAAGRLDTELLGPQWKYSRAAASVDYATGNCPRF